ncbi:MAG: hypothetical protein JXQ80_12130 [Bacteroidales bacterium]|nr:hypothetical protein [Bacteroidales bacterium]
MKNNNQLKADVSLGSYGIKIAGLVVAVLSTILFLLIQILKKDLMVYKNLNMSSLAGGFFCLGLILFIFSKEKNPDNDQNFTRNVVSRLMLTALYVCLTIFSIIQFINADFEIQVFTLVAFFLIIHLVVDLIVKYKYLTNKQFYVLSTILFFIGLLVLMLL